MRTIPLVPALACATVVMSAAVVPGAPLAIVPGQVPPVALLGGAARWPSDTDMHRQFLERFKSAVGLGRSRMVSPSLQVREDMYLSLNEADEGPNAETRYRLRSLELVGIARHAAPVAFVAATHVDRSNGQRTRALDGFEQRAMTHLRAANDVVAESSPAGRQVMGAIRATSECTACHTGSRPGDLLGALSYRLDLVR
jgi:hypothetical protein